MNIDYPPIRIATYIISTNKILASSYENKLNKTLAAIIHPVSISCNSSMIPSSSIKGPLFCQNPLPQAYPHRHHFRREKDIMTEKGNPRWVPREKEKANPHPPLKARAKAKASRRALRASGHPKANR